jgi:hypothetical protein
MKVRLSKGSPSTMRHPGGSFAVDFFRASARTL